MQPLASSGEEPSGNDAPVNALTKKLQTRLYLLDGCKRTWPMST